MSTYSPRSLRCKLNSFFLILNLLSVQRTKMKKKATLQFTSLVTLNKIFAQISYLKLRNSIPTSLTQKLKPSLFLLYVALKSKGFRTMKIEKCTQILFEKEMIILSYHPS